MLVPAALLSGLHARPLRRGARVSARDLRIETYATARARVARQTGLSLRLRRRASQPSPAKPVSVIAQVDGSGTLGAKPVVVALLILNADKKPDVNRVAFVSIAI